MKFSDLPLMQPLLEVLSEMKIEKPTAIQTQALPPLLDGRDLLGQSATGSGKTLAFTLPLLEKLVPERMTQALVLAPTRELAEQVAREIRRLGRKLPGLQVTLLTGGQPFGPQADALSRGAHIAVGTPGRVLDHLNRNTLYLGDIRYLVLDEADRMLDMGFSEEVSTILEQSPSQKQTVLFSATFPPDIEQISSRWQNDPVKIQIENNETKPNIEHYYLPSSEKNADLQKILGQIKPTSAVVFCHLKVTVKEVAERLPGALALHGDLEQADRDRVLALFRGGSSRVLVATDVAARGLDVDSVDLVVNYDIPKPDIYTHRVGRTGRAGRKGKAILISSPGEKRKLTFLEQDLGIELNEFKVTDDATPLPLPQWTTLVVWGGRKDKVRPGDLLGALTGEAGGFAGIQVGKIEIKDRFSYVAVASSIAPDALEKLQNGKIKGRKFRASLA